MQEINQCRQSRSALVLLTRIFLAGDQLFGVEELSVGTSSNFICKDEERWAVPLFFATIDLSYRWQLVLSRRRPLGGRVCQHLSRWRRCWTNRHHHRWFCPMAFVHRVGYHVPNSTIPNRRYQFEHRLDRHGWRYIHASTNQKIDPSRPLSDEHFYFDRLMRKLDSNCEEKFES